MSANPTRPSPVSTSSPPDPVAKEQSFPPGRVLIDRKQRRQKVPLCDRTILDMEKRGEFPQRFLIAHKVVWDLASVDAWIEQQQAAGRQAPPPGTSTTAGRPEGRYEDSEGK